MWKLLVKLLLVIISLQVFVIILLAMKVCPRIPELIVNKLLTDIDPKQFRTKPEIVLACNIAHQVVIPAFKDVNQQGKDEAAHRRSIQTGILEIIKTVPNDRKADLLLGLQRQDYDGCAKVIGSISDLYCGMIDSFADAIVRGQLAEKVTSDKLEIKAQLD